MGSDPKQRIRLGCVYSKHLALRWTSRGRLSQESKELHAKRVLSCAWEHSTASCAKLSGKRLLGVGGLAPPALPGGGSPSWLPRTRIGDWARCASRFPAHGSQRTDWEWCSAISGSASDASQRFAYHFAKIRARHWWRTTASSGFSCWPRFGANPLNWS